MKLHNTYTVSVGGKTFTAYNSVTENFWTNMGKYPHWANFIALTATDGTSVYAPAVTETVSCNPSRGDGLHVKYTASVACLNKRYTSVSLCADKTASGFMSRAALDLSSSGDTAEIAAVIHLETAQSDYVTFCGGDNPLVRRLLGCGEDFPLRMGWGTFEYPSVVCERTTELIQEFFDTEFTFTENGMHARVDDPTYGVELVLFTGDTSLMRAVRPYEYALRFVAATADSHLSLKLGQGTDNVSNITVNGNRMIKIDKCGIIDSITPLAAEYVVNLGSEGSVKTDPAGEYVLFLSTAYAEVYKIEGYELRLLLRVTDTADYWEICRGGSLLAASGTTVKIYEQDANGNYDSFTVQLDGKPIYPMFVAAREGDRYHIAFRYDTLYFRRYEITRTGVRLLATETGGEPMFYVSRCGDALVMGAIAFCVKTIDADYTNEYIAGNLATDRQPRLFSGIGDGYVYFRISGFGLAYDIVHNERVILSNKLECNGRIIYGDGKLYIYDHYNGVREVETGFDMSDVTSMCLAGSILFVMRGTKLYSYYCNSEYTSLRLPADAENTTVTYNVRERAYTGNGKGAVLSVGGA